MVVEIRLKKHFVYKIDYLEKSFQHWLYVPLNLEINFSYFLVMFSLWYR